MNKKDRLIRTIALEAENIQYSIPCIYGERGEEYLQSVKDSLKLINNLLKKV